MRILRFSIAQTNFKVGDLEGNLELIKSGIDKAVADKSDVVVFPELSIAGYPPEDLIYKQQFIQSNLKALDKLADYSSGKEILIIAGFIQQVNSSVYNAAGVIHQGAVKDIYQKIYLPNYGVFDEKRYFSSGSEIPVYNYCGVRIGINICEDIWYPGGPMHYQSLLGEAEVIVNISASPFHAGKQDYRERMFSTRAGDESVVLINCNLVGGQDELVFDGASTVYNENGDLIARLNYFMEDFASFDVDADGIYRKRLKDIRRRQEQELKAESNPFTLREVEIKSKPTVKSYEAFRLPLIVPEKSSVASIYEALVLGTKDYINKNGFDKVIVAVSGGIDSALVAAIAADALGKDRVKGIYLPSQFSADISGADAKELCINLGIEYFEIEIQSLFQQFQGSLLPLFKGLPFGIAEENLQSRIRGNLVMALSNKFGYLVLTTGNKSEMSAGYATLYGDMAGGFAVIKDVLKTTVYELTHYRNSLSKVIPERIVTRPPTAELRPNQKDSDSLPDYAVLDRIIREYVEEDKPVAEIADGIGDEALVNNVVNLIDKSEYKRRQSPPGIKITPRAFGRDRRMPITNGFNSRKKI